MLTFVCRVCMAAEFVVLSRTWFYIKQQHVYLNVLYFRFNLNVHIVMMNTAHIHNGATV